MKQINILVSQPNFYSDSIYLPYLWAVLKTHCNNFSSEIRRDYNWLPPIYENKPAKELVKDYQGEKIDILCLSCYVWNSQLNYEIAGLVRQNNPACLVIAGGPDLDYKNKDFFREHPEIDVIVKQDGEIPLRKILLKYSKGDIDFRDIPGLVFCDDHEIVNTGNCELPTDLEVSPYLQEKEYFKSLLKKHQDVRVHWESNRGCPYKCVYCDWGSVTNSKIRKIPMERLSQELEWFAEELGIDFFIISDANFGILPRDLEITDKIVQLKKKTTFPNALIYFPAKNCEERTIEIAKRLYEAEIIPFHTLGLQHTDKTVLEAMNRKEIALHKQKKVIKTLNQYGVPTLTQLILGTPGDTVERWKKTITDVMEMGCHEEYRTNLFNLLRGSRAWDKDYREKWGVETVSRYTCAIRRKKNADFDFKSKSEYIVGSKTFTRDDWVEMYLFDIMAQAFHNGGITRFLSMYLRLTHHITYSDFYNKLFKDLCFDKNTFIGSLFNKCKDNLYKFAYAPEDDLVIEEIEIEDLPDSLHLYKPEEYVLFKFLINYPRLWDQLEDYTRKTYDFVENLDSIIDFQKEIIITVDYDLRKGKEIALKHNWLDYFKKAKVITGDEGLDEPEVINKKAKIKDMMCGAHSRYMLSWVYQKNREKMLENFLETVVGIYYTRAERTYFKNIKIIE